MQSLIEKWLSVVLVGLAPPYPVELKAEYVQANEADQKVARREYLKSFWRWAALLSGMVIGMSVKWMWECGFLAWIGMGAGFAHAADIDKVQQSVASVAHTQATFQHLYELNQLQDQLRGLDRELFDLQVAILAAQRAHKPPDPLHVARQRELEGEKEIILSQLVSARRRVEKDGT